MFKMSRQDTRRQVRLNKLYGEPHTWRQVRAVRGRVLGNLPQSMWQGAGSLSHCYTTEENEKIRVQEYAEKYGSIEKGIAALAEELRKKS